MATLDVTNNTLDTVISDPKEMLGIFDLRLVGYYKIKQGVLQQNLSRYYIFESADNMCEQFNKFVNPIKEGERRDKGDIPMARIIGQKEKHVRKKEILDKYIDLDKSCLLDTEKKQVMDMLHKDAFSVGDKIGTCPNIEVKIDIYR